MNKLKYILYTLIMMISISVYASPPASTRHLSNAMFAFILSALMVFLLSYLAWRLREQKKRGKNINVVNRGPVKRPMVAYRKKRVSGV